MATPPLFRGGGATCPECETKHVSRQFRRRFWHGFCSSFVVVRGAAAKRMKMLTKTVAVVALAVALSFADRPAVTTPATSASKPGIWQYPADIASRDLYYGPGGKKHAPHGQFSFAKEDLDGSSPKFTVEDRDGVRWKVKLGLEAQSETAATRIVWAVGYFTDEDYLIPRLRVLEMPERLHRGASLVDPDGWMLNARL